MFEQGDTFTYLGRKISYEEERDLTSKISRLLQIMGILNYVLKPNLVQRQSHLATGQTYED